MNNRNTRGKVRFLIEGMKNFNKTGSFTPSGDAMCRRMTDFTDYEHHRVLIELGAGDGVITRYILNKMHKDAVLLCFEINESFYEKLESIKDERLIVIKDSAEHVEDYLQKYQLEKADCIISALPFIVLPKIVMKNILDACFKVLKDDGVFVQMHYALTHKSVYEKIFRTVKTHFVAANFPPGYVFECRK